MTRSLYTKFLLGYLVFGLLGFIFIATMSSEITYQYLLEEKSESLYDEANLLAKAFDMDINSPGVTDILIAPDMIQQLFTGKDLIRRGGEEV